MEIPKKYQKVFDDFQEEYDFVFLDSLRFAMYWRWENKLVWKEWQGLGYTKHSTFRKYVATLVEGFYEKYIKPENRTRKALELGFELADWLLKTPIDYIPELSAHSEMDRYRT